MSQQLPDYRGMLSSRLQSWNSSHGPQQQIDPKAELAVAQQEGLSGLVGDNGTSFGANQLHRGGALPASIPLAKAQQWAWSPQGIDYALGGVANVAGGLKGKAAISSIVSQFEKPADPASEIANAQRAYDGPIDTTARNIQKLKDQYGTWEGALSAIGAGGVSAPAAGSGGPASPASTFNASAPSDSTVSTLESLGGIAARTAKRAQEEIPLPSKFLGQIQGPKGGVDIRYDHNEPLSPNATPIIQAAEKWLGTPYLWGGSDPRKGFDCSGFVQYLYKQEGVNLPRTTYQQVTKGQAVHDPKDLQAGDIVFFSNKGNVHHEGLYIGNNQFIHAPHTGDVIRISSLKEPYYKDQFYVGRRVLPKQGGGAA